MDDGIFFSFLKPFVCFDKSFLGLEVSEVETLIRKTVLNASGPFSTDFYSVQ